MGDSRRCYGTNHKNKNNKNDQVCIFQDVVGEFLNVGGDCDGGDATRNIGRRRKKNNVNNNNNNIKENHDNDDNDEPLLLFLSQAFFELANSSFVGYRLLPPIVSSPLEVVVQQDIAFENTAAETIDGGKHSGKIVWEASFVLMQFLLERRQPLGRTLEVGAGCGLLGMILAASELASHVVLTDTQSNLHSLRANLFHNRHIPSIRDQCHAAVLDWEQHVQPDAIQEESTQNDEDDGDVENLQLLEPHTMDTIVGTDVIFTPKLVVPLLQTLQLMSHPKTIIYLCLPIRCIVAYQLLFSQAAHFGMEVTDMSDVELASSSTCSWGRLMECRLLKFHVVPTSPGKK